MTLIPRPAQVKLSISKRSWEAKVACVILTASPTECRSVYKKYVVHIIY